MVQASKIPETPADAELNKQVESAMQSDRYFFNYHVRRLGHADRDPPEQAGRRRSHGIFNIR